MNIIFYNYRHFDEGNYIQLLAQRHGFSYNTSTDAPTLANAELAANCDAISLTPCPVDRALLERFSALGVRYVMTRSIGFDHIDLDAAHELGITVIHAVYPPPSVADYALMLMLMSLRKANQIIDQAKLQNYALPGKLGRSLSDCTVGVIGAGRIGSAVVRRLVGFGCRILVSDPNENEAIKDLCERVELDQLIASCDVIDLHAPATETNRHLLDAAAFAAMKPDAIVINTARGSLIDTKALVEALRSHQIAGAALDVLEHETGLYYNDLTGQPLRDPDLAALRSLPNVILTPHTAFYTQQTVQAMADSTVEAMLDIESGNHSRLSV